MKERITESVLSIITMSKVLDQMIKAKTGDRIRIDLGNEIKNFQLINIIEISDYKKGQIVGDEKK